MEKIRAAFGNASGPLLIAIPFLIVLSVVPGNKEAILLGAAAGQLTDPVVMLIAVATSGISRNWWQTSIGGAAAALWFALRPHDPVFMIDRTWFALSTIAGFLSVAISAGIIGGIAAFFRKRKRRQAPSS